MVSRLQYRVASVLGTVVITSGVLLLAGTEQVQSAVTTLPVFDQLRVVRTTGDELLYETAISVAIIVSVLVPLFKPRPRRTLDTVGLTCRRTLFAATMLATVGYFDYTYRLPRLTVLTAVVVLLPLLSTWFVAIRRRPDGERPRAVIVGDDPEQIQKVAEEIDTAVVGYVAPSQVAEWLGSGSGVAAELYADGGEVRTERGYLGGLSQLEEVLVANDIGTAVLAFERSDRGDFFGVLNVCYERGVAAKVHRASADSLLTDPVESGPLVSVSLEPWDWQDRLIKRLFDLTFAAFGLLVLLPVILVVSIAIKYEDGGSILYSQERTATFGDTFTVYKFRSMVENAEAKSGATLSDEDDGGTDPRVTRVGRVLRQTHVDEVPQLWAILVGHMSVVGPRPERPELDADIRQGVNDWHKRWFVKPGLTGLAQINGVTGYEPERKLRYDIKYVRDQSFTGDIEIVVRQVYKVVSDSLRVVFSG